MHYLVKGTFFDTPTQNEIRTRTGYLEVKDGKCVTFCEQRKEEWKQLEIHDHTGKMILPGFTDLHLHAPQYNFCGCAMDLQLLEWLNEYTFPEEAKFQDLNYAKESYKHFVHDLLHSVTTRCCVFGTIHTEATIELMEQLEKSGLISYVGKVCMNRNCPDNYTEHTTNIGIQNTSHWLEECKKHNFKNTKPIITPRFTPSVTDTYMEALGKISQEQNLSVQSHLSENTDEIKWVHELCPETENYAETYDRYGLLKKNTIMAHCVHTTTKEKDLLKNKGVYIAHCPTSNEDLASGIAPAAYYLRNGFHIGLGTDVAGGHTLNLLEVITAAIQCSKLRYVYIDQCEKPLTLEEAFYIATVGGGSFFGKVGLFEEGYDFDAVIVDDHELKSPRECSNKDCLERYAYQGSGKVTDKYVAGEKVL